jgi:hypothetical protein
MLLSRKKFPSLVGGARGGVIGQDNPAFIVVALVVAITPPLTPPPKGRGIPLPLLYRGALLYL